MQFEKTQITKILNSIKPNLNQKNMDLQLAHIFFTPQSILSFNGKVAINHPCKTDLEFSVDGQRLFSVVSKMPGEKINFTIKDQTLLIKGENKSEASIKIMKDISVLNQADFLHKKVLKWNSVAEGFNEGLNLCRFSVSKDLTKPALSCISVNHNMIFSSDNFRISKWEMKDSFSESFLIPGNAANILSGFDIINYMIKGSWIHFKTKEDAVVSCLIVSAEFPDVEEFFDIKGSSLILPEGSKELIADVSVMLDEDFKQDQFIDILFSEKDDVVYFSGSGQLGNFKKAIQSKSKIKKNFNIKINPDFLTSILDKETKITVNAELSNALFKRENFSHIIRLMGE